MAVRGEHASVVAEAALVNCAGRGRILPSGDAAGDGIAEPKSPKVVTAAIDDADVVLRKPSVPGRDPATNAPGCTAGWAEIVCDAAKREQE